MKIIVEGGIADNLVVTVKECMQSAFIEIFQDVPFVVEPNRDSWVIEHLKP